MSSFLRCASVKCPGRTISWVKKFCWTSHSFTFREGLGIRYFIPRTADTRADTQTERKKDLDSMLDEFKLIYNFPYEAIFEIASYSALAFAIIFFYAIYDPNHLMKLSEHKKEEENETTTEELVLEDNYTPSGIIDEIKTLPDSLENIIFHPGDIRPKSFIGLAMIMSFFYVRSRCVLKIYRRDNDYITVLYRALGFGKKVINHKASDGCYYSERKFFNYNLMGKNVIIFPELFVNYEEEQLFMGRKSQ